MTSAVPKANMGSMARTMPGFISIFFEAYFVSFGIQGSSWRLRPIPWPVRPMQG